MTGGISIPSAAFRAGALLPILRKHGQGAAHPVALRIGFTVLGLRWLKLNDVPVSVLSVPARVLWPVAELNAPGHPARRLPPFLFDPTTISQARISSGLTVDETKSSHSASCGK